MDDTQQSRMSDAAATRKRRSSILKSQRPARTPFSELEFNVATPTDTAKSRRVSFSRRTGVAEFITNEATNTWKNFYEEHNKSLESSSNDSEANAFRQPVGHLGKRIFDQQFEEVEAVDFIGSLNPAVNSSLNNVNFTQQLASLECSADGKLTAPHNKFELSAFTDQQSKLFGNDFTAPSIGEQSGRIDINFSMIQQISEKDDLDDIQRDLERGSSMGCHGPFSDRQNMSEYIEVDLNMTHVADKDDEDMSITDTIHSPVQDVSIDKKASLNQDWVTDKENIAINPYAAPSEANFAVNEVPDQVLVFDGKRLTLQPDIPEKDKNYRQTLLPNSTAETPQRKTIVLNVNDDLPNFVDDILSSNCENSGFVGLQEIKSSEDDISEMLPMNRADIAPRRKTILDNTGNISITQALSTNIICGTALLSNGPHKRRTILFDENGGNISMTQALPVKLLCNNDKAVEKRRTVVYNDDTGDISVTQAVSSNIIIRDTEENKEKRKTILFNDDLGNLSVTQALPSNVILDNKSDKRQTIVFDDDLGNISVTQALPSNFILGNQSEKRKSILFNDDLGDISVTQALPSNLILENTSNGKNTVSDDNLGDITVSQSLPSNVLDTKSEKRKTILFNDVLGNLSVTQALPSNLILDTQSEKRKTIVFDDNLGDISVTQALPTNVILENIPDKRKTTVFDADGGNVSITQELLANILAIEPLQGKRRTIIYENDTGNISVTQVLPTNVILPNDTVPDKTRTVSYEDDTADISVTQAVMLASKILLPTDTYKDKTIENASVPTQPSSTDVESDAARRRTIVFENDTGDISLTQAISTQVISGCVDVNTDPMEEDNESIRKSKSQKPATIVYDENDDNDISMTEAISSNIIDEVTNKRKTIVFGEGEEDVSMTLAISTNIFLLDKLESGVDQSIKIPEVIQEVNENVMDDACDTNSLNQVVDVMQEDPISVVLPDDVVDAEMSITKAIHKVQSIIQETEKRRTVIFDYDNCNKSITKPIPAELMTFGSDMLNQTKEKELNVVEHERINNPCGEVIVYQATDNSLPKLSIVSEEVDLKSHPPSEVVSAIKSDDVEVTSADISLLHPRVDEKSDQMNLKPDITTDADVKVFDAIEVVACESGPEDNIMVIEKDDSVLNTLLDMSTTTLESGTEDKNMMAQLESNQSLTNDVKEEVGNVDNTSNESMFYIMKDSEDNTSTDGDNAGSKTKAKIAAIKQSPIPQLEYKEEPEMVDDLEKKLAELKTAVSEKKTTSMNRFYERVLSSDLEGIVERDEHDKLRQQSINFKKANDTKELLDMISDFTDKQDDTDNENDTEPIVVRIKGHAALENKEVAEPRRLSFAPNRPSIALSREDLLNNISMAQAALQKSRLVLDDSDNLEDDTRDESMNHNLKSSKKPARTSNEVVKTLHFDDESLSEMSFKSETKQSPLKKTAFGETSYMIESKVKVIPTYLKDVSDGIKELMLDLVKPMSDNLPFEGGTVEKNVRKAASTQSTQIQANLVTSSQVDVESDMYPASDADAPLNISRTRSVKNPVKFSTTISDKSSEFEISCSKLRHQYAHAPAEQTVPPQVLIFDHLNPLNNILIGSLDYSDAHKYNPKKSDETLCGLQRFTSGLTHSEKKNINGNIQEKDNLTTQYRVESRTNAMQGDTCARKKDDQHSILSDSSRPLSVDQSIDTLALNMIDNQVNTLIAMKENKELLEASSSLTLVDDAMGTQSEGECKTNSRDTKRKKSNIRHEIKMIDNTPILEEQATETEVDKSEMSSQNEMSEHPKLCTKGKKRIYSPCTNKYKHYQPSVEVTPKPSTKMQKISNSPRIYKLGTDALKAEMVQMAPEKDITVPIEEKSHKHERSPKEKKLDASITVQQLITEYSSIESGFKQNQIDRRILDALNPKSDCSASQSDVLDCLEPVSSFTSSKNLNSMKTVHSTSTTQSSSHPCTLQGAPSRVDWHPDLIGALSSNLLDSESGVNVVAKIDMLPFMGSHECEWESSSGDTWSFRLLHGRLRLTARLAHRHDNATRTRVRSDTPVLDIAVETVQQDRKNPVATLCVRFACETMRYMVSRAHRNGATCAADVPPLLRRCAAVARVALRWGRAMHDAKLHLAYTLDNEGYLTLKVANIPLRSVWEVTMRVELVVEDAREAPWPRAGNVRVARVVSDVNVPEADVRRALAHTPRDWGHAPRTIWRMFRYLKHKTRDDDLLLA